MAPLRFLESVDRCAADAGSLPISWRPGPAPALHFDRARDHRFAGLRTFPSVPEAGEAQDAAVCPADEIRLPAVRHLEPLVVAACQDDAPITPEGVTEHRLVGNGLRSRVEAGRQLLQGLFPPPWYKGPAH
jgi:hypothetical protein